MNKVWDTQKSDIIVLFTLVDLFFLFELRMAFFGMSGNFLRMCLQRNPRCQLIWGEMSDLSPVQAILSTSMNSRHSTRPPIDTSENVLAYMSAKKHFKKHLKGPLKFFSPQILFLW